MNIEFTTSIAKAKSGDKVALEELILSIQDQVFGLAIRMLFHPADAEDATQEIIIKVITHLDSFRHESAFTTWVYRIAANHLLAARKSRSETPEMTFDNFEANIDRQKTIPAPPILSEPEQSLAAQEIMISCTQAMLICLSRDLRIAFILGEISEISSGQCAHILSISPEAFRKRLSRARTLLQTFMQKKCGLVNPDNPCSCSRYISEIIKDGAIDQERLLFTRLPCHRKNKSISPQQLQEMNDLQRVVTLYRSHPEYGAPERFVAEIKELLASEKLRPFIEH